jgi:hypothetical protein
MAMSDAPFAGAVASGDHALPIAHVPLGIRINNPGNIRATGEVWLGMATDQSAGKGFVVYIDAIFGLRAFGIVLRNYQRHDKCATPRQIVTRWAPPAENDTEGYIAFMCSLERGGLGLDPEAPITLDAAMLARWIPRQTLREQGQMPYSEALIANAVTRALAA